MALRSDHLLQDFIQESFLDIPRFWFYRGEGNDTIVVGLKDHNVVLRLKKTDRNSMDGDFSNQDSNNFQKIRKCLDFNRLVFLPLMGGRYVRVGHVVQLPPTFTEELDKLCEPFRPKDRLHKGIYTKASFAVLMPDLCFLPKDIPPSCDDQYNLSLLIDSNLNPTFSVEIKPKCGFLPSSPHIKETHAIKHNVCHYCMLQGVKVEEGKYPRQSRYCPVNLLSGDPKRVFYALKTLVSDPQNNLRIFKDGFPIFNDEISSEAIADTNKDVCCPIFVLEEALRDAGWNVRTFKENGHKCDVTLGPYSKSFMLTVLQILIDDSKLSRIDAVSKTEFCNGNGHCFDDEEEVLQKVGLFGCSGVLKHLSQVQKMDDIDVEGLYPLYLKVKKYFKANFETREELSVDGPYNSDIWKQIIANHGCDILQDKPLDKWTIKEIVFKLCQFSVASTAKDCSMMIAFQTQPCKPKHLPFIEVSNNDGSDPKIIFAYNIDLVDLDPKEFDRVQKYFNDSCKTVQHFIQNNWQQ